ncbi:TlpA family protein disulfide reductase, partial [Negadavirga shengliensis]
MNHHHKIILPLLFLTLHLAGATPPDTLKTGDKIPPAFTFQQILNQNGKPLRADALTGRHLILQFWSTTCNASIRLFTQMKDIHAKYGDRIRVLPVTFDPEEKVTATLRTYPALRDLDLPMAVNERQLHTLFPHITIPHIVIADPDLKVLAVTGAQDLTEENIEKLLAGQQPAFRTKEDVRIPFLHKEKFISENRQIPHKNIRFQSSLSAYIPGVSGALVVS